ncbi:MAG: hypothetical protein ACN4GR_12620 [Arenicellales bacterium]
MNQQRITGEYRTVDQVADIGVCMARCIENLYSVLTKSAYIAIFQQSVCTMAPLALCTATFAVSWLR